jgi:hypothetical protein
VLVDDRRRFFRAAVPYEFVSEGAAEATAMRSMPRAMVPRGTPKGRLIRLEIAKQVVEILVPFALRSGTHVPAEPHSPEHFKLGLPGYELSYLPRARDHTHGLLDIWIKGGRKVFSASWSPLEVIRFQRGDWIDLALGLRQGRGVC